MGRLRDWARRAFSGNPPGRGPWPPEGVRVRLIGTDYQPSEADQSYRAPDPYVGFTREPPTSTTRQGRTPRRRRRSTAPGESPPPWGAVPPSIHDPTPSTQPPATPSTRRPPRGRPPSTRPSRARSDRRRGRGWAIVGGVLGVVAVVIAVAAIGAQVSEPDDVDAAWSLSPDDIASGTYTRFVAVDGTATGSVVTTAAGWVVRLDDGYGYGSGADSGRVAGIDPTTGRVLWTRPLPDGRCTQRVEGEDLICLARTDGEGTPLQLVALDPATGEPLGDPVPTELEAVPATLSPLGDGLVALGTDRVFTALGLDGATRWQRPLVAPDWDSDYQVPDITTYPDAVVVRMPIDDETVHLRADGEQRQLECGNLVATTQAWICEQRFDWTLGYAPDGSEMWRVAWSDLHMVSAYQRTIPVALAEVGLDVAMVDPLTGSVGVALSLDSAGSRSFLGDTVHPVVTTDDSIALVDPVGAGIEWETPVQDAYLSIATGGVVDGVLVVDGESLHGLDPATGEQLWERASPPGDVWVQDEALIVLGSTELSRLALP